LNEPADSMESAAFSPPQPSPLRVQPASMLVQPGLSVPVRSRRWETRGKWATVASTSAPKPGQVQMSSSEHTVLSSLHSLAAAIRPDRDESPTLHLHPRRPVISLDLGVQSPQPGVSAANALPRRTGPRLPGVTAGQLDGLTVAGR